MLLHFFPGLGLGLVFAILQLLDLLDVMTAMRQKKACTASFGKYEFACLRTSQSHPRLKSETELLVEQKLTGYGRHQIGFYCTIVAGEKLKEIVLGAAP